MRLLRAHSKLAVVLGFCALAAVGVVTAVITVADDGKSAAVAPSTGAYAPISVSRPKLYSAGGALLSDPGAGVQAYLTTMVSQLPGAHRYRITITNTSNVGFVDSFQWYPPMGVRVVRLIGSSAGHCELSGLTGFGGNQFKAVVLYPNILCDRVNLKPPSCTCLGDGGSVDISFAADRVMTAAGAARMISARLVLHPILSYLPSQATQKGSSKG